MQNPTAAFSLYRLLKTRIYVKDVIDFKMKLKIVLILVMLCQVRGGLFAANPGTVKLGTFPIPLMIIDKDTGVFIQLAQEIAKRAGFKLLIEVTPPKRTLRNFVYKELDILMPAVDLFFPTGSPTLKSRELIYIKRDFIFTLKRTPLLRTLKDLEGKIVGITAGYTYAPDLTANKKIELQVGVSDEKNALKLAQGRIDAFVVEEKTGLKAFENTNLGNKIHYDPAVPLSAQDVYFAFQDTDRGRQLEATLSTILAQLKKDGTFDKILNKSK
ncbi:MAG: transporter substrate-binding domain-containing protein [bacterium]|nr:transporter substrate-binding domain-containing protein [bacterium]